MIFPPFFLSEAVMAQASRLERENIQSEAKLCSQVFHCHTLSGGGLQKPICYCEPARQWASSKGLR